MQYENQINDAVELLAHNIQAAMFIAAGADDNKVSPEFRLQQLELITRDVAAPFVHAAVALGACAALGAASADGITVTNAPTIDAIIAVVRECDERSRAIFAARGATADFNDVARRLLDW